MKKIIFSLMACAALCACSSDDIISDTASTASQDDVYMKFNLTMSSATRSATGDTTTEEGQASENNVGSVLVMIVTDDGTIAASSDVTLAGSGSEYVVTFSSKEVASISGSANVYVYCNPESALTSLTAFDADATYTLTSASDATPWTSNAMFMSSAKELTTTIPADLSAYNSEANAYELGTVEVERSIARFDYKDGSQGSDYTYTVSDHDGNPQATITLSEVALVNMSNSFYHLRRVAATSSTAGVADYTNTTLLGEETANNWVIDTDAAFKLSYSGESAASNFTYVIGAPTTWDFASLSTGLTTLDDGYGIWRYATENTIPSISQQKKGISTIAVFKGLITPLNGVELPTDGSRIYVYDGVLYGTWDDIATVIDEGEATTSLQTAYDVVMGVAEELGEDFDEYNKTISQTMQDVGFTGYSPDEDGNYYTYYYYYNQHNVDASEATMGIMEYAVVRNNVYKLSVTDITAFGHPTPPVTDPTDPRYGDDPTPDPDPDPEDPDGPIIDTNTYFRVDVQILPWTVRVNDIEF